MKPDEKLLLDCIRKIEELSASGGATVTEFLKGETFRKLQTECLGLYTGLFAIYDPISDPSLPNLTYCLPNGIGTVHFPFYTLEDESSWIVDPSIEEKQRVARYFREEEAKRRAADFYTILNDPKKTRLTKFEQEARVLYAPDGEFSIFFLGCLLRLIPRREDLLKKADLSWKTSFQLDDIADIRVAIENASKKLRASRDIIPEQMTFEELFHYLGFLHNEIVTERLILFVNYLNLILESPTEYEKLFSTNWIRTANVNGMRQHLNELLKHLHVGSTNPDIKYFLPIFNLILSNPESAQAFGNRSRIGLENLFAHMFWRANSQYSRSWVVVPLQHYPLKKNNEFISSHVIFFLGTFKDTTAGRVMTEKELLLRFSDIRILADALSLDYENVFLEKVVSPRFKTLEDGLNWKIEEDSRRYQIIGDSTIIRNLRQMIKVASVGDGNLLIFGPTGSGKELVARHLHIESQRRFGPFIPVDCGILRGELVNDELFGHDPGAFTGATTEKIGFIEQAELGTLFLDNVDALPIETQEKLLRVLDDKMVKRLGPNKEARFIDVRFVFATNKNPRSISEERMRRDFLQRITPPVIETPALRDHKEDIPLLVEHIITEKCSSGKLEKRELTESSMTKIYDFDWHNNVRQLRNFLEWLLMEAQPNQDKIIDDALFQDVFDKFLKYCNDPPIEGIIKPLNDEPTASTQSIPSTNEQWKAFFMREMPRDKNQGVNLGRFRTWGPEKIEILRIMKRGIDLFQSLNYSGGTIKGIIGTTHKNHMPAYEAITERLKKLETAKPLNGE